MTWLGVCRRMWSMVFFFFMRNCDFGYSNPFSMFFISVTKRSRVTLSRLSLEESHTSNSTNPCRFPLISGGILENFLLMSSVRSSGMCENAACKSAICSSFRVWSFILS